MINNPLFRKFKENSLWWLLIAVFTLLLGVVTVSQDSGVIDQPVIFAEQPGIDIDIEKRVQDGMTLYVITIEKDGKLINEDPIITNFDPRDNERGRQRLEEDLRRNEGIDISADDYPEIEPPISIPSMEDQIKNAKLANVRITTSNPQGMGKGSGFSIGEYIDKKGRRREAIITNWHVIRDDSDGKVKIEIFDINGKIIKTVTGIVNQWDSAPDLAIVSIPAASELPSVIISSTPPEKGNKVFQVGCPHGGLPAYFPQPGQIPTPQTSCVVTESNFIGPSGELIFIDPRNNLEVEGGRSGGGIYNVDSRTGVISVFGVCNSVDPATKPPRNIGCSSTSLNKFLDKPGWKTLLRQQEEARQALIDAQK